jgi:RNA polymerase-associated protein
LKESVTSIAPIFNEMAYFFSEEFSLVDCAVAPLLWRLRSMGIELGPEAKAIMEYAKRLFDREPFQVSLTDSERALEL